VNIIRSITVHNSNSTSAPVKDVCLLIDEACIFVLMGSDSAPTFLM
jgi:hypothetical protein